MEELLGPVAGRYMQLLLALGMVAVERFLARALDRMPGHPLKRRAPLARAMLAKMMFDDDGIG